MLYTIVFHILVLSTGRYQWLCRYNQNAHTAIKSDCEVQFNMYMYIYSAFVCLDCYWHAITAVGYAILKINYSKTKTGSWILILVLYNIML